MGEFVLVAVNTAPGRAVQEMDQLYDVFTDISKKWNTEVRARSPSPSMYFSA